MKQFLCVIVILGGQRWWQWSHWHHQVSNTTVIITDLLLLQCLSAINIVANKKMASIL